MVSTGDLEMNRLAEDLLEGRHVAMRSPDLELGIARGPQSREVVVAARIEVEPGERLRVAPVQPLGETHHR